MCGGQWSAPDWAVYAAASSSSTPRRLGHTTPPSTRQCQHPSSGLSCMSSIWYVGHNTVPQCTVISVQQWGSRMDRLCAYNECFILSYFCDRIGKDPSLLWLSVTTQSISNSPQRPSARSRGRCLCRSSFSTTLTLTEIFLYLLSPRYPCRCV